MIKDGIMLPSVFNDLFEEGEGRKALIPLFSFEFLQINSSVSGFSFQFHSGNLDMICPSSSLTFRALCLGGRKRVSP